MKSVIQRLKEMEKEAIEAGVWPAGAEVEEEDRRSEIAKLKGALKEGAAVVDLLISVADPEMADDDPALTKARAWLAKYGGEE